MMTEDEWQDYRRKYLGQHNIYLPDTPEMRKMHSEGTGIDSDEPSITSTTDEQVFATEDNMIFVDIPATIVEPEPLLAERPLTPAEKMVRAMRERHQ